MGYKIQHKLSHGGLLLAAMEGAATHDTHRTAIKYTLVEKCDDGGAFYVGTNGAMMIIVYDKLAEVNHSYAFPTHKELFGKDFTKAIAKFLATSTQESNQITIDISPDDQPKYTLTRADGELITKSFSNRDRITAEDFPDWRGCLPTKTSDAITAPVIDCQYMTRIFNANKAFLRAQGDKKSMMRVSLSRIDEGISEYCTSGPAIFKSHTLHNTGNYMYGVVMPVREGDDKDFILPDEILNKSSQ